MGSPLRFKETHKILTVFVRLIRSTLVLKDDCLAVHRARAENFLSRKRLSAVFIQLLIPAPDARPAKYAQVSLHRWCALALACSAPPSWPVEGAC